MVDVFLQEEVYELEWNLGVKQKLIWILFLQFLKTKYNAFTMRNLQMMIVLLILIGMQVLVDWVYHDVDGGVVQFSITQSQ